MKIGGLLSFSVLNRSRCSCAQRIAAFVYSALRVIAFPMTGGYYNPARSLSLFSVTKGSGASTLWIYVLGSPLGGVLATVFFVFLNKKHFARLDGSIMQTDEDEELYPTGKRSGGSGGVSAQHAALADQLVTERQRLEDTKQVGAIRQF